MNCKDCAKFNTCEKAKNPENYALLGCKEFKLRKELFVKRMGDIHLDSVEKILTFADSSGIDRNKMIVMFIDSFITMAKFTDYNNYEVKK